MFHVNPQTGEAGKCSAKHGKCPFGDMNVHFTTIEAAREAFEGSMAGEEHKAVKKDGRALRGNWPDLELYREAIGDEDEVFVHPQGKIVIATPEGKMQVFRNGKKATTSGTLNDLRNGRGSWSIIKKHFEATPDKFAYRAGYENTDAKADPAVAAAKPTVTPKEQANVAAGYPATSQLDASKAGNTIKPNPIKRQWQSKDRGSWGGSPILPVDERANPHSDMKTSEWLTGWNGKNPDGTVKAATIEVWKSPSATGKGFNYKMVATSGDSVAAIGSEGGFYHDQSGANMGEKWTMAGAFKTEEGGEAIGEIPDRKMPLYTYK